MPRRFHFSARSLVALAVLTLGAGLPAGSSGAEHRVALVDVATVVKQQTKFIAKMDELRKEVQQADAQLKQEQAALAQEAEKLKTLKPGAPEHTELESTLAKRQSDLGLRIGSQKKEFMRREAAIYHAAYQRVLHEVERYAEANDLTAVLRFSVEEVDENNPQAVLQQLNRPVLWRAGGVDITATIAARVNAGGQAEDKNESKPAEKPEEEAKPAADKKAEPKKPAESKDDADEPADQSEAAADEPEDAKPAATESKPVEEQEQPEKVEPKEEQPKEEEPAKKSPPKKDKPAEPKKATVVRLTVAGGYPEGPASAGLFGEMERSLDSFISRVDAAAKDDDVDALWLRIRGVNVGRAKLHEMRSAVARFRETGKPVYADLTGAETPEYLLAAACDEIVMAPSGMLSVPGVRAEMTFYKGLFDKLGIQFDVLQMGKYKGAGEPYTRTEMSPPLRESMEALVDDTYDAVAETIAADREMPDHRVKTLMDTGMFTPAAAKRAGLIDEILYDDQLRDSFSKRLGADDVTVATDYRKKKIDTDFSGLSGMMKLMELVMGGKKSTTAAKAKQIAVIYAVGPIVEGSSAVSLFGGSAVGSSTLVAALREADKDENVKAVVLRIDSPGGSATASDLIWRATTELKKPIIASMGDVAGSGGYYIAMGAQKIIASPGTVTGSIGVVGGKLVLGGLYDKLGITTEVISRGQNSGAFSEVEPFTPEQRKAMTAVLKDIYHQFVGKAAKGRGVSFGELEKLAQGRVYTGRMAEANGLIDELGTLRDAVVAAKKAAGLKADEEVELLILPKQKSLFEQLFSEPSASTAIEGIPPELAALAGKAQLLKRLFREPVLMWMPYELRLR